MYIPLRLLAGNVSQSDLWMRITPEDRALLVPQTFPLMGPEDEYVISGSALSEPIRTLWEGGAFVVDQPADVETDILSAAPGQFMLLRAGKEAGSDGLPLVYARLTDYERGLRYNPIIAFEDPNYGTGDQIEEPESPESAQMQTPDSRPKPRMILPPSTLGGFTHPAFLPMEPLFDPKEGQYVRAALDRMSSMELIVYGESAISRNHAGPMTPSPEFAAAKVLTKKIRLWNGNPAILIVRIDEVAYAGAAAAPQLEQFSKAEIADRKKIGFTAYVPGSAAAPIPFRLGTSTVIIGPQRAGKTFLANEVLIPAAAKAGCEVHYLSVQEPLQPLETENAVLWTLGNLRPQTLELFYNFLVRSYPKGTKHCVIFDGARTIADLTIPGGHNGFESFGINSDTKSALSSISRVSHPDITSVFLWTTQVGRPGQLEAIYDLVAGHSTSTLFLKERQVNEGRLRFDNDVFENTIFSSDNFGI